MRESAERIVTGQKFRYILTALIVGSTILQGARLSLDPEPDWLLYLSGSFWLLMLVVLVVEVPLKMFALSPRIDRYFRDGWNLFDFLLISSLIVALGIL